MADNTQLNIGVGGNVIADEDIGGVHFSKVKIVVGAHGIDGGDVDAANPLPITGAVLAQVGGFAADGAPPVGFPVWISGWDGVNIRALDVSALGQAATRVLNWFGSTAPTVGQKTMIDSIPVVLASDQTPIKSTGTGTTQVPDSAVAVVLLAANAARRGGTIFNDSTSPMIIKWGAGVTLNDWSVAMAPSGYIEIPFGYTGQIEGMWQAATATGEAKVTEFS